MKKPFIKIERREKPAPIEPKYKWLLPLMITIAVVVLVGAVVYAILTGAMIG
jgi:sterol desaturase/sphingolipid hydroxylase (fatty acid hydroxylase superfamily)